MKRRNNDSSNSPRELSILLADDDKDDCLLFGEALEELRLHAKFTAVHDCDQLMHYLTAETVELPTVLFLDLNMPRKNGLVCLEELKCDKNLKQVPVIIYSTSYDIIIADRLYQKGAHHYICKPAEFSQLKSIIEYAIGLISEEKTSQPPKEKFLLSNLRAVSI